MKESGLWSTMKRNLERVPGIDLLRIENSVNPGTHDLNLCLMGREAWVELKHLHSFPVRNTTPVKIDHYTTQQKERILKRGKAGGRSWLFVQVGDEYFLFNHIEAQKVTEWTAREWRTVAVAYHRAWKGKCDWTQWLRLVLEDRK